MSVKVTEYFESTVMPMIRNRHSEVLPDMSVMILGSVGLGIDDELSDMEAAVYLNDPVWKKSGGQLQLSLNDCLFEANPWRKDGSVISVYPLSWLLDGHAKKFLTDASDLPWESVSFETLFTMQESLIFYDPQRTLQRLRESTAPSRRPEYLWKKSLLLEFNKLIVEDLSDLKKSVMRNRMAEAHILLGHVLEELIHIGFLIFHKYYPWRTHLRWAFDKHLMLSSRFGSDIDLILTSVDWYKKIEIIEVVIAAYKNYITLNALLPEIDIWSDDLNKELMWAERLKAWETPNWRNWITNCTKKAIESGNASYQFWVWSL